MMKFHAEITVMPLKALLDPQGKAVNATLHGIGYNEVSNVRIGKHVNLEIEAATKEAAIEKVTDICSKVLSNPVMEGFEIHLTEVKD